MPSLDDAVAAVAGTPGTGTPAAAQPAKQDPIGDAVSAVIGAEQTQRRATMFDAVRVNPDQAAKARRLSAESGVPSEVALRNLQDLDLQLAVERYSKRLEQPDVSQTLRNYFTTSDFARLAHDDIDVLTGLDAQVQRFGTFGQWQGPAPTVGSVLYGLAASPGQGFAAARAGLQAQMSDTLDALGVAPMSDAVRADRLRKLAQASYAAEYTTPAFESGLAKGVYGGATSLLRQAPGMAMSIAARSPTPALVVLGMQTEAESYAKYRARGATPGQAAVGGLLEGGVEVATEKLPMKFLTETLGKAGMREFVTGLLAREIPSEQLATILQDATDTAIANPDKTWAQYLNERPGAAFETLVATVTQSALLGGISSAARRLSRDQTTLENSERDNAQLADMVAAASESKLRERAPGSFAEFVQSAAQNTEGAPTAVYVDARALTDALNQAGIPDEQLDSVLPSVRAQIETAFDSGGVVEIPIGEALAAAPGTPLEQVLLQNARLDPEGLSQVEVDEANKQADHFIKAEAERIVADAQARVATEEQTAQIRQTIADQLGATGRFRPEANDVYATMVGAFYSTTAQRLGITPAELYARYPLRVTGEVQEQPGRQLQQISVPETPELRNWFGDSKVVDSQGKPRVMYHGTAQDITAFRPQQANAIFLTDNPDFAAEFAVRSEFHRFMNEEAPDASQNILPVLVKADNPFDYDNAEARRALTEKLLAEHGVVRPDGERALKDSDGNPTLYSAGVIDAALEQGEWGFIERPDVQAAIKALGHDGFYVMEDGEKNLGVYKPEQIKSAIGNRGTYDPNSPNLLEQGGTRATFSPSQMLIALGPNADYSSFLHESGHAFLEILADMAVQRDAPAQVAQDWQTTLDWFGLTAGQWAGMTLDEKRKYHERWAESIEQYFFEGKAPSVELRGVFDRFRTWLTSVYKSLKQFLAMRAGTPGGQAGAGTLAQSVPEEPVPPHVAEVFAANGGAGDIDESTDIRAKSLAFAAMAEAEGFTVSDPGAKYFTVSKSLGQDAQGYERAVEIPVRVSDHSNVNRSVNFGGAVVNIAPDDGYARDTFASALWKLRNAAVNEDGDTTINGQPRDDFAFYQRDEAQAGPLNLTNEVRQVMDRLLATDEQIADAERVRQYGLLFKSPEEAGMTPEQWAQYTSDDAKAHAQALADLTARNLRDFGIVSRKRIKALREVQRDMAEKRKEVEKEAAAVIDTTPIEQAKRALREAAQPSDAFKAELKDWNVKRKEAATGFEAEVKTEFLARPEATELKGIQKGQYLAKAKREIANEAERRALQWEKANPKPRAPVSAVDMAAIADAYGFPSVEEMQRELVSAFSRKESIEGLTDQMMLERYGEMTTTRGQERVADEAVHNEMRARVLAAEMAAVQRANDFRFATPSGRTTNALVAAAKQFAERVVEGRKIKDLKPQQFTGAETRAARAAEKALAKGDTQGVIAAKRDQLLNFHTARAVNEARTEAEKSRAFMRKIATAKDDVVGKTRDLDVVKAAQAVVGMLGIGERKAQSAVEYLAAVQANDPAMYAALEPSLRAVQEIAKPFDDMTVGELRLVDEELQALWYMAKRSRQMEVNGNLIDIQEAADEVKARLVDIGIPENVPGDTSAITPAEQRALKLRGFLAAARRVESWAQAKDGDNRRGPFRRLVWEPVREAANAYRVDKAKYLKQFKDLLAPIESTLTKRTIEAPELGYVFGRDTDGVALAEILHAVLHTGNESNKRKMLIGRKWAVQNEDGTLDTSRWDAFLQRMAAEGVLRPEHFTFAQGVWDLLESTKPMAQKTHREVFGKYFAEVTADKFTDPFGIERRGGYIPAQADARIVKDQATRKLMEDENASMQFAFPTTSKGFTKSRVENYNRPLLLDLRSLTQHIDKVLLFAHMEGHVRDVRKLLTNPSVSYGLNRIDPVAFDAILTPWLNRAAKQQVETPVAGDFGTMRFFSGLRRRAGMAAMFGNVANAVQQLAGFSMAAVRVPPSQLARATAQFVTGPREMAAGVASMSDYMAVRMGDQVANMSDAIDDILINPSVYQKGANFVQRHAYFLQQAVDNVMGPIIWTGAYNEALERGDEARDAVRYADSAVRETQGSTAPEDVSRIETGNAFVRLFTQFAGYFNMQANLLGTEMLAIPKELGLRKGLGRGLYVLLFGFLVNAWAAEAVMQLFKGGPDDEDKDGDYLDDWLAQVFGWSLVRNATAMVPVAGQAANSLVNTFNKKPYDDRISTSPAISMIESAVQVPNDVYKTVSDKDVKPSKVIRDVATLTSLITGVPANAFAKPAGYAADVAADRVEPTSAADAVRGTVTGTASPESKRQ